MKKKLVIKFWKTERALAMQIIEQEGLPNQKYNGDIKIINGACFGNKSLYLRGCESSFDFDISAKSFESNQDRDEYLNKVVNTITDELFTSDGELKVGEMCEIKDYDDDNWEERELLAVLPNKCLKRYIVMEPYYYGWISYDEARPIAKRTEPKVETNGEILIYTWDEK